ncbi:MAG: hypothetical protein SWY16_22065 [Cyanobacteriota bacterium]|nr:hypothetical protein [Cyanobacteriota bacterium]
MENFGLIVFGNFFLLIGILPIIFDYKITLSCRRDRSDSPSCAITLSWIMGSQTMQFPLSSLKGAFVEFDEGNSRIVLVINTSEIPIRKSFQTREKLHRKFINKVNYFLKNPEEPFLFAEEKIWWSFWLMFSVPFIFVGIATISSAF